MGSATFTRDTGTRPQNVHRGRREVRGVITMSSSYATNGDTLTMTTIPMDHVTDLVIEGGASQASTDGYQFILGGTSIAPKIVARNTAGEIANTTDLSSVNLTVRLVGY